MLSLSDYYKSLFNCKIYKVSLDAHCSCPNRDGTKSTGGCIFCSQKGSGDFIHQSDSITEQFINGKKIIDSKALGRSGKNKVLYLPYFQAFTSTWGEPAKLETMYEEALEQEDVCGIAIATRPDCISPEILYILKNLSQKNLKSTGKHPFIQIELGLQSSMESTGKFINRCYSNQDYLEAVSLLKKEIPQVHLVTHLILGLPDENKENMMDSVDFVVSANRKCCPAEDFFGIKITNLYVLSGTVLGAMYEKGEYKPLEKIEYLSLLKSAVNRLPQNCVVHRLTGDPPKNECLAPQWCLNKKAVLNEINKLIR